MMLKASSMRERKLKNLVQEDLGILLNLEEVMGNFFSFCIFQQIFLFSIFRVIFVARFLDVDRIHFFNSFSFLSRLNAHVLSSRIYFVKSEGENRIVIFLLKLFFYSWHTTWFFFKHGTNFFYERAVYLKEGAGESSWQCQKCSLKKSVKPSGFTIFLTLFANAKC